jgi:hypothetical protein
VLVSSTMLTEALSELHAVHSPALVAVLLSLPSAYMMAAYSYLAWWHHRSWLLDTVVHENGRLTLLGSMLYFDHFVGCVPMAIVFALCAAGGVALTARVPADIADGRAGLAAAVLLGAALALVAAAFMASVGAAGWQRTIDYALQRIERDGVTSRGGTWNQLQLSNIPIALGAIGAGSALKVVESAGVPLFPGGWACLLVAGAILVGMSLATRFRWASFRNPRWLAHSMREVATFPLTGIPMALASVVLVERALSGPRAWAVHPGWPSLILLAGSAAIVAVELALVRGVDVLALAQRPAYASEQLSIPYLLAAHVFEHTLDFALIALASGGFYALVRSLTAT